jgi:hypothetical protein
MQTILYQGRPGDGWKWQVLTTEFVPDFRKLDYQIRELVLRDDAERAKVEHFNAAIEKAARVAEMACLVPPDGGSPTKEECAVALEAAKRIRALKIDLPTAKVQS